LNIEMLMTFSEDIWTSPDQEIVPEIKSDIEDLLTEELGPTVEYILQADSRGLGANYEVVSLIIGIPSGIAAVWFLAEKVSSLISKLRNKGGVLLPEKEALMANINSIFSEEDLTRVRLIRSFAVSTGSYQKVRLGDFPFLYSYVIVLSTEGDKDEIYHLLINDSGQVIDCQIVSADIYSRFYGNEYALSEYFFKK
jgi:hypothetical protein